MIKVIKDNLIKVLCRMSGNNVESNNISGQVLAEQVRLVYAAMPLSILAIVLNSGVLVIFQWQVVSHFVLLIWLSCLIVITILRGLLLRAYNQARPDSADNQRWLCYFAIGVVLSGLIWGSTTIWLFPDDAVGNQILVAFVIAGMSAGATTSLSYFRSLIITFLSLLLIPLSIRYFLLGDSVSIAMGIMSVLFFIMMSSVGARNNKNILENITLRIEAKSHEKVLRESEEKYRHIFNSSPLGIVHYDVYGVLTDFNSNFLELVGASEEELKKLDLMNDTNDKELQHAVSQSLLGELSVYEGITKSIAGNKETDVRIFFRGMHSDESAINGGVAILEDISEDKRVKKLKDEFISTISHELRTPLTAVRGAVGLLLGGAVGKISDSACDMLNIANTNIELLLLLINDILDIDKIESGTMVFDMKSLMLMEFLDNSVKSIEMYAKQHNVGVVITKRSDDEYIMGDEQRLMQVMYNLLSNAAKFSPEGSEVEITTSLEKEEVVISVTDHGEGIPVEFQSKVFERFTQADASDSRRTGGTGLGLSIAKRIIEKHQGNIDFTTSTKGTTFRVKLKRNLDS